MPSPPTFPFACALLLGASQALAEGTPHPPFTPAQQRMCRAGCANQIAPWARYTYNERYWGQYLGGSVPVCGGERCVHEGTWGVNYSPRYSKIRLNWSQGARHQDGGGQYQPDGKVSPISPEH